MNLMSLIILATAVSIDGFWGGFAFGLRRIQIPFLSLLVISSWSVICSMIVMLIGHSVQGYISFEVAKYIGAVLLFLLGLFTLKEGSKQKKECLSPTSCDANKLNREFKSLFKVLNNPLLADVDKKNDINLMEGTLLGIAVAMDASIAAFTVSLLGFNPLTTPFLFGLTHFVLIGLGNIVAKKNIINHIGQKFALLPGCIIIILAIIRLI